MRYSEMIQRFSRTPVNHPDYIPCTLCLEYADPMTNGITIYMHIDAFRLVKQFPNNNQFGLWRNDEQSD